MPSKIPNKPLLDSHTLLSGNSAKFPEKNSTVFFSEESPLVRTSFITQRGFTMLETLAAIFVITVAVTGIFALIAKIIFTTTVSSYKLTAAYLAQEGVEIVRNIRDTNWLRARIGSGTLWYEGLDNCSPPVGCEADYNDDALTAAIGPNYGDLSFLKIFGGFYTYDYGPGQGEKPKFKRRITIERDIAPERLRITSDIEWEEAGTHYNFTVKEYLYNWLPI